MKLHGLMPDEDSAVNLSRETRSTPLLSRFLLVFFVIFIFFIISSPRDRGKPTIWVPNESVSGRSIGYVGNYGASSWECRPSICRRRDETGDDRVDDRFGNSSVHQAFIYIIGHDPFSL